MLLDNYYKKKFNKLMSLAGIQEGGARKSDLMIKNEEFYKRVCKGGSLAFGESYTDGWWDCQALDELFFYICRSDLDERTPNRIWITKLLSHIFNYQNVFRAKQVGRVHYDLDVNLFHPMLGESMTYTCGYWRDATSLDQAQYDKMDLICRKLQLEKGMKLLDIGCGWGNFAKFAATNYHVEVVGISISKSQVQFAKYFCAGLPVEIRNCDYRHIEGEFDRVSSIGMFEAVGHKNYRIYFDSVAKVLKNDGLFLLETIGCNKSTIYTEPWFQKNIFPNGMMPSMMQISKTSEAIFIMEDWHNFSVDYDRTLMAWYDNFNASWNDIENKFNETFKRMWVYYLLSSAGAFRSRKLQNWQIVFSKNGVLEGHYSIR